MKFTSISNPTSEGHQRFQMQIPPILNPSTKSKSLKTILANQTPPYWSLWFYFIISSGDMELKKDKSLPPEKQILTANPDINAVELCEDDDFIVLACDGIWDCMSSQQLVDFVREQLKTETKLSAVCEKVFDRCLAPTSGGEGCDNMTMILVQFKNPPNSGPSTSEQPSPDRRSVSSDTKDKPEPN